MIKILEEFYLFFLPYYKSKKIFDKLAITGTNICLTNICICDTIILGGSDGVKREIRDTCR